MFIKSKIQFFESKSQQANTSMLVSYRCLSSQRYNFLKANHNPCATFSGTFAVVYQVKDTIFWKQITTHKPRYCIFSGCLSSQRYNFLKANHNNWQRVNLTGGVVYQVKDTIFWKQITTRLVRMSLVFWLFIKSKIQFFESKSQLACFGYEFS